MSYILCGYDVPVEEGVYPKCLLYDESKGTFGVKTLRFKNNEKKTCMRATFGKDQHPPFLFSRVVDNAFTGGIRLKPGVDDVPVFTVDTAPHTILTESDIDVIFEGAPTNIMRGVRDGASICTKMTEREYVKNVGFKQSLLRAVRSGLIEKMGLRTAGNVGGYVPTRMDSLFVGFEPVDYYATSAKYPHGPDSVILRHKIIKHVLEDACVYIKVAMFDSLGMEKALSLCLPTGSSRKATDVFWPREQKPAVCLRVADDLMYDGGDFHILTPEEAAGKPVTVDILPSGRGYFDWIQLDSGQEVVDEECRAYRDFKEQLSLLKSVYVPGETAEYFRKAAVVYSTHGPEEPFACLDFVNFYANVAVKFGLDDYVSEVLKRMTAFRGDYPAMKGWIVTLLGKARWADPFFYNRMKALSVAVVISTIGANSHIVTGSATDGLMVKPEAISEFVYPAGFPVKREFVPREGSPMMSNGPATYSGVCRRTGEIIHRGCIGRGKHPDWFHDLVTDLISGCLGVTDKAATMEAIRSVLTTKAAKTNQYLLPDTHRMPLPVSDKRRGTEYYINELCTGICQMYGVIGDNVIAAKDLGGHDPPPTQNAWVIKQINVDKYVEEIGDKISRVAALFSGHPEAVGLCETAVVETVKHIERTLPKEPGMYPGGVDYA
jgi:hypothetical protein